VNDSSADLLFGAIGATLCAIVAFLPKIALVALGAGPNSRSKRKPNPIILTSVRIIAGVVFFALLWGFVPNFRSYLS
jgi:hypothetical protein